jgi:predicted dehydrogenase
VPVRKHLLADGGEKIVSDSPVFSWEEPYTQELQDFINCIANGTKPQVDINDAILALEISLAAIKSAETGEAVVLGGDKS